MSQLNSDDKARKAAERLAEALKRIEPFVHKPRKESEKKRYEWRSSDQGGTKVTSRQRSSC